ncbi:hypothetical protein [Runella aurantiaca]|uniref:DUF5602 domain-containing protein n=1 Tax=Runella aurantiaca TaxID=2282308 RepID=A0A369IAU9_9BACT|nr:hypothetical protein [Runella aurantiaca]RDB05990.1 hypothetical protein DVG78_11325 [Runella aurantiaca]
MKKLFFACATLLMMLGSCKKDEVTTPQTYKGAEQTLGNGKAYSWVTFSENNLPTSIGMTFTKGALDNLSHTALTALVLKLPTEAVGKTPFDHIFLSFSHTGHEPPGIYDVAHFDIHFYMQPLAEREAIPPYMPNTAAKFDNIPADGYMPKPYIKLPGGVPTMGAHWANPTSTELNGGKFTETFIMGSYDGKVTFYEPMVTLALLQSSPNITKSTPIPTKFANAGYYPMKYSIKQEGDNIVVSLDEMMMMQ